RTPVPGCRARRRSSVLRSAGLLPFAAPVTSVRRLVPRLGRLRSRLDAFFCLGLFFYRPRDYLQDERVRLDLQGDARRELQLARVHRLAGLHALDVDADAPR